MKIKVGCACDGCGDHRVVNTGKLKLLISPEELVKEVTFVCYRHQEAMLAKGVLSDHLALLIHKAVIIPGKSLNWPGVAKQIQFLLDHKLLEQRIEPIGNSKVRSKHAYYATEAGKAFALPFLNNERQVSFSPYWDYTYAEAAPWELLALIAQKRPGKA